MSGQLERRVCAGVLIKPQWVLTAGSCVQRVNAPSEIYVGFGDSAPKPADLLESKEAQLVVETLVFPDFSGNPRDGADIALLYLERPINATFPRLPNAESVLGDNQRLVGLGWGLTEINDEFSNTLQVADRFLSMRQEQCGAVWDEVNNVTATIDERVICVWTNQPAALSICDGDEGGPLLILDTGSFNYQSEFTFEGEPALDSVYGVASFGPEKCGSLEFSVYTNIVTYLDWINDTIANFIPPPPRSNTNHTIALPPGESEDEGGVDLVKVLVGVGVATGVVLALAGLSWILCQRRPKERKSGSSTGWGSTTFLKRADASARRQNQMAIMNLSPFLASPEIETLSSDLNLPGSPSSPEGLQTNIEVKLVGRKIGSGAFGQVEEGIYVDQHGVEHNVAVKSVKFGEVESRDSLINEIRIFDRVGQHPNIVRCFGGRLYVSMDDLSGYYIIEELMACDLGQYFKDKQQRKKITLGKYLEIFHGVIKGLEHLHECEVIHFDLKPGNILLDADQCPKLADFGCSRQRAHSYITAGARGTVAYMAPELWLLGMFVRRGQVRAEKVDIFSLGVVMWESLTNRSPVDPLSMQEFMNAEEAPSDEPEPVGAGTNEDFRSDRFPLDSARCPDPLKALIWDCVSYYNNLRPTVQEVKSRIEELLQMPWTGQNLDA